MGRIVFEDGTVLLTREDRQSLEHFALQFEDGHTEGQFATPAEAHTIAATSDVAADVVRVRTVIATHTQQEIKKL